MSATPRLVPDHECKQGKCGATTTGCWDRCSIMQYQYPVVYAATLPAAPAPTEQQPELPITRSTYGSLEACEAEQARRSAAPTEQADGFLMPEDAWNEYATRSGLLNEHGVAPDPVKAQTAYFAYQAAWNCLHAAFSAYIAARQAPAEAPKDQAATIELLRSTMQRAYDSLASAAMAQTRDGEAAWRAMGTVLNDLSARQAPDSRDAALEEAAKACELAMMKPGGICDGPKAIRALKGPAQ